MRLSIVGPFFASVASQGVSSIGAMALSLWLVQALSPTDFGWYGVAVSIATLYSGFCNALLATHVVVSFSMRSPLAARKEAGEFALIILISAMLMVSGAAIAAHLSTFHYSIVGMMLFVTAFGMRDYCTRIMFALRHEGWAAAGTLTWFITILTAYTLIESNNRIIDLEIVFIILFISSTLGSALCMTKLRINAQFRGFSVHEYYLRTHGRNASWALIGTIAVWLQSSAFVYSVAVTLGPEAVASVFASRILVAPILIALPALSQILVPRLTHLFVASPHLAWRRSVQLAVGTVLMFVASAFSVWIFRQDLAEMLAGDKYNPGELIALLPFWLVYIVFHAGRSVLSWISISLRAFRAGALIAINIGIVTASSSIGLCIALGPTGALLAMILGETLLIIALLISTNRILTRS